MKYFKLEKENGEIMVIDERCKEPCPSAYKYIIHLNEYISSNQNRNCNSKTMILEIPISEYSRLKELTSEEYYNEVYKLMKKFENDNQLIIECPGKLCVSTVLTILDKRENPSLISLDEHNKENKDV